MVEANTCASCGSQAMRRAHVVAGEPGGRHAVDRRSCPARGRSAAMSTASSVDLPAAGRPADDQPAVAGGGRARRGRAARRGRPASRRSAPRRPAGGPAAGAGSRVGRVGRHRRGEDGVEPAAGVGQRAAPLQRRHQPGQRLGERERGEGQHGQHGAGERRRRHRPRRPAPPPARWPGRPARCRARRPGRRSRARRRCRPAERGRGRRRARAARPWARRSAAPSSAAVVSRSAATRSAASARAAPASTRRCTQHDEPDGRRRAPRPRPAGRRRSSRASAADGAGEHGAGDEQRRADPHGEVLQQADVADHAGQRRAGRAVGGEALRGQRPPHPHPGVARPAAGRRRGRSCRSTQRSRPGRGRSARTPTIATISVRIGGICAARTISQPETAVSAMPGAAESVPAATAAASARARPAQPRRGGRTGGRRRRPRP